jgi:hypothetical protein
MEASTVATRERTAHPTDTFCVKRTVRAIASLSRKRDIPAHVLSPKNVTRFSDALRAKLRDNNPAFRKSYLRTFIKRVEVGEKEIRISGPKAALLSGLAADTGAVPSFAPEWWWTRSDANSSLQFSVLSRENTGKFQGSTRYCTSPH